MRQTLIDPVGEQVVVPVVVVVGIVDVVAAAVEDGYVQLA